VQVQPGQRAQSRIAAPDRRLYNQGYIEAVAVHQIPTFVTLFVLI
jgi:hypothetical protein